MVHKMHWLMLICLIVCGGQIKIYCQEATEEPKETTTAEEPAAVEEVAKLEKKPSEEKATEEPKETTTAEEPAVVEEVATEETPEQDEIEGIDTVDVETPAGNWLLKRIWWEKAKNKFNKIRLAVNKVADNPMQFFAKQNEFEKSVLNPFYREVGLEQGELQEVITELIAKLNQEREEEGELDLDERDVLRILQSDKKRIEQLEKDVSAVSDLDGKLDEAFTLLLQQVNKARNYENQAWQQFDAIAHELSDQKAQELYYSMDAILKSIQGIDIYIHRNFSDYFDNIVNSAKGQTDRIRDSVASLKKQGVDLKDQVGQLVEDQEEQVTEEKTSEPLPKKTPEGIFTRFLNWVKGLWNSFLSLFKRK